MKKFLSFIVAGLLSTVAFADNSSREKELEAEIQKINENIATLNQRLYFDGGALNELKRLDQVTEIQRDDNAVITNVGVAKNAAVQKTEADKKLAPKEKQILKKTSERK